MSSIYPVCIQLISTNKAGLVSIRQFNISCRFIACDFIAYRSDRPPIIAFLLLRSAPIMSSNQTCTWTLISHPPCEGGTRVCCTNGCSALVLPVLAGVCSCWRCCCPLHIFSPPRRTMRLFWFNLPLDVVEKQEMALLSHAAYTQTKCQSSKLCFFSLNI